MKPGSFMTGIALVAMGGEMLALLVACASDVVPAADSAMTSRADDGSVPEGGLLVDAGPCVDCESCVDCDYFQETCSPDSLCLNGPFDPAHTQGDVDTFDLRTQINSIVGRGPADVWAVGTVGALAHFDGTSWKRSGPDTKETLQGLWLLDDGEIVFGSKINRIFLHGIDLPDAATSDPFDDGWSSVQQLPTPSHYNVRVRDYAFESAWASPGAQWIWCGLSTNRPSSSGRTGLWRLRRRPDATFEIQPGTLCDSQCDSEGIASIHGTSPRVLWAVGSKGAAFRIDDADGDSPRITAFNSLTWNQLHGVWAVSESEAWAVGVTGTIRHYVDGSSIAEVAPGIPPGISLRAVWGASSSDIWAVGDASVALHYDGESWSRVKIAGLGGRRPDLTAVWMPASGHVWIGGQGVILSLGGRP